MRNNDTMEDRLAEITLRLNKISVILNDTVFDLVSNSRNWREAIAEQRNEICRKVADIACGDFFGGDTGFTHSQVYDQVQMLFDEMQQVIDNWALRVMTPEVTNSCSRILH